MHDYFLDHMIGHHDTVFRSHIIISLGHSNDFSKSLSVITELRKIAMHPLLVRHHYHDKCLREMSRDILKDPAHQSGDPDLIYEDMTVMSDYELHNLCIESKVREREGGGGGK